MRGFFRCYDRAPFVGIDVVFLRSRKDDDVIKSNRRKTARYSVAGRESRRETQEQAERSHAGRGTDVLNRRFRKYTRTSPDQKPIVRLPRCTMRRFTRAQESSRTRWPSSPAATPASAGRSCTRGRADVKDAKFCRDAVAVTAKELSRLNILVNHAAFQVHTADIENLTYELSTKR